MRDVKRELDGADNRKKQAVAETIENQMDEGRGEKDDRETEA